MNGKKLNKSMRIYHRYLGFFLAGIMGVYAISGTIMIFRNTDFLKRETKVESMLPAGLQPEDLGPALRMRNFKVTNSGPDLVQFEGGIYNPKTGLAVYTSKELPFFLKKMTDLHKATSDRPRFFLNVFFGFSLLFFVLSSFWMFLPRSGIFKKSIYFALAGVVLTILVLFV